MTIKVTREAVCLADDQLEPLELTLEFGTDATLENFANKLTKSGFLHFSSTCRTLVGCSLELPLLKIKSRWGSQAVEYLLAADTMVFAVAAVGTTIDFCFERASMVRPVQADLDERRPVWLALSDMFLDTDTALFRESNTRLLAASPYSVVELDAILREEVYPACSFNLWQVAGEWTGFHADWLERRILCGGPPPRPWHRRLQRYLTLGWSVPVRLPEEWASWRQDIVRLRTDAARCALDPRASLRG